MIDKDKLNPLVRMMATDLQQAKCSMGLGLACSAIHFKMANIASQLRLKVDIGAGFGSAVSNFYGLTFSPSGSGKSVGVNLLDNFYFSDAFEYIKKDAFPQFNQKALDKLKSEGVERELHTWTPKLNNATLSGLYAYSETYFLCGMGSVNIQLDEVGDAVTSKAELFDILLECYNNGDFPAQAKRSDSNALDINGISVNLYAFGDPTKLVNGDNTERAFQNLLKTGYGRRFIFSQDDSKEISVRSAKDIVMEMKESERIKHERADEREKIRSLVTVKNMNKTMLLSEDALYYYATIQSEGEEYTRKHKNLPEAVISDMLNRTFKLVKLASIYAFFEGKDIVEEEHMIQAMEIIRESSRVLAKMVEVKPLHIRLLDELLKEDKAVTSQSMLSYQFIPSSYTKKINEYIFLAKERASELGYIWTESERNKVVYYHVKIKDKALETEFDNADIKSKHDEYVVKNKDDEANLMALLGLD